MLEKLWSEVLNTIKSKVNTKTFNLWLCQTKLKSASNEKVEIEVPNNFVRDKVVKEYKEKLYRTLLDVSKNNTLGPVSIVVSKYEEPLVNLKNKAPNIIKERKIKNSTNLLSLNPHYVFENFIIGDSNRFAHAASLAVAESPAYAYNPLFIYGGVGLGKTHLVQAIAHKIIELYPDKKVLYLSSERFTNEFIESIRYDKSIFSFKNKYRNIDVLLIDDIQFLAGKDSTKEEFFHTFNTLYESYRQIVITSDRPPRELPAIEERLRSRFESGLTTDIQIPGIEMRIAILRKKSEEKKINVSDEILNYIASRIKKNTRELLGALNKVAAFSTLSKQKLDISITKQILKDIIIEDSSDFITIDQIQNKIVKYFRLHPSDMRTKKRSNAIALPRQIAMYLCRELTNSSLPEIGERFGGRDHSTVIHACEKIKEKIRKDEHFNRKIDEIKDSIREVYN
ncbi:MAG: chromosomal replication initiator protein DnaA [bacterium]|nr:chromosomal replication initiator protein DnaA [bacterium]